MKMLCINGEFVNSEDPSIPKDYIAKGYGDLVFETMMVKQSNIQLEQYHFARLSEGMQELNIDASFYLQKKLVQSIIELCTRNEIADLARVRLSIFKQSPVGNNDESPYFIIDTFPLSVFPSVIPIKGLHIGFLEDIYKEVDHLANAKTNSALLYKHATNYAKERAWSDVLISNNRGKVIESSIANLWWIKEDIIYTPPLADGCVNGVMRRYIMESLQPALNKMHLQIREQSATREILLEADEIFLTNAIRRLQWVQYLEYKEYAAEKSSLIFELLKP